MSQDISLEEVIRTIVSQTGLSRDEIRKKIDATIASFDGLLTEVGAALIIGDKLGVKVNAHQADTGSQGDASGMDSALKIKDIIEGTKKNTSLKNIIVFGRVTNITPPHEFQKKDGRKGAVASITLKDATGQIRVSCWDQKANLVEASIKQGAIIGIINAYTKIGREGEVEVHVDNRGTFKPKPDDLDESSFPAAEPTSVTTSNPPSGTIKSVPESATFTNITAKVLEKLPPKTFTKKDGSEGSVARVRVADESSNAFVVFWADRMDDYNNLNVGEVYQFESLAVKKNTFGGTTTLEFHANRASKITKSTKKIDVKVDTSAPGAATVSPAAPAAATTIANVTEDTTFCTITAKVLEKLPPKTFTKKDGSEGSIARVRVADESSPSVVVFWADRMDDYNNLNIGEVYQFENISVKKNTFGGTTTLEFHVNRPSKITNSNKKIDAKADAPAPGAATGSPAAPAVTMMIADVKEDTTFCTITAKVLEKLPPKTFTKKDGSDGSVARVRVADESSPSVVVFWADRMDDYNNLNAGDVYQFEKLAVKKNTFGNNTTIEFHANRASKITKVTKKIEIKVRKLKIGEIAETQAPISFEGRVKAMDEERQIALKDGTQTRNIKIMVADETGSINIVAWRDAVDDIKKFKPGDPIKVENVTVSKSRFNNDEMEAKLGKETKITKLQKSAVPVIETVTADKAFQRKTSALPSGPAQRLSLDQVEDNMVGEIVARVINVSKYLNNYMACPKCKKKVTLQDNVYTCVNDGKQPKSSPRLIAKMTVDDGSGKINVTMIGDSVVKFFGISEKEKMKLAEKEEQGGQRVEKDAILARVNDRILLKSYLFRGKIKLNEYQKELEIIADSAVEVDLNKETALIVKEIESAS